MTNNNEYHRIVEENRDQQAASSGYKIDRGLENGYDTLPSLGGLSFILWLEKRIAESNGRPIRIYDVGTGAANFLIDLKKKYGDAVEVSGINSFPYHEQNKQVIEELGISIEIGDIQTLNVREQYNAVTARHSLEYVSDPLNVLQRIYDSLAPGGGVFIDPFSCYFETAEEEDRFRKFMEKKYGFTFGEKSRQWPYGSYTLSFTKTEPKLIIPTSIARFRDAGNGRTIEINQASYHFENVE